MTPGARLSCWHTEHDAQSPCKDAVNVQTMNHRWHAVSLSLLIASAAKSAPESVWSFPADVDYCDTPSAGPERDALLARLQQIIESPSQLHTAQERASAILTAAGLKLSMEDAKACRLALQQGQLRFERVHEMARRLLKGQGQYRRARDQQIAAAQRSIAQQWQVDQVARQSYIQLQTDDETGPAYWALRLAMAKIVTVDAASSILMNRLLSEWDWIDRDRFGAKVSNYAWLLVQHADHDPALQRLALERMRIYLTNGGIKPANYAYLHDRVSINSDQLQRYGTQPVWRCTGDRKLKLHPVEQPELLDARRAELSMKPAQQELDHMAAAFCSTTAPASDR